MLVDVQGVYKNYGKTQVLRGLDLAVEDESHNAIVGASGSGKSTLMYLLGGLDRPDQGRVCIGGRDLASFSDNDLARYRNREVGFMFQFHFLLPSMKCIDNILLPCRIAERPSEAVMKQAHFLARELQVEHCLTKYPHQLSGGEQQRINLIRALSLNPKLLLCDEPTGNLDSINSQRVITLLRDLAREFHATLLVVTHDEKIAQFLPRKITIEDGLIIG